MVALSKLQAVVLRTQKEVLAPGPLKNINKDSLLIIKLREYCLLYKNQFIMINPSIN